MSTTAKLFLNGRSQAVRLPAAFRFEGEEVYIRQDAETGDVILSRKPLGWDGFFSALEKAQAPSDFLSPTEREQGFSNVEAERLERDPFADWRE